MPTEDRAQRPGDVEITKLKIISSSGDDLDIKSMFQSIDIFEDIFNNCISGAITIIDSLSMIENMPLIGNEKIFIVIKTPSLDAADQLRIEGRIYKITDRAPVKDNSIGYVLHFASPEMIYSAGLKISKTYKEMKLSEMAQDIYKEYLEPVRKKRIVIEPTIFTRSVIIPNWSPFYALNWFAKNCKSDKHMGANYLFFERRDSYIFTSLETLFKTRPVANYFYGVKNETDPKKDTKSVNDFYNADTYKVIKSPDTLQNISSGMFAGKLITNDLVKRKINTKYFNYPDSFNDFSHLAKSKLTNSRLFGEFVTGHITVFPQQFNAFGPSDKGNYLDEVILERKSQLQQINNICVELSVPGNTERAIGDVVTFKFPSYQPSGDDAPPGKDKYMSGKYLVTSLRHNITQDNHVMTMQLSRDAYSVPLPPAGWTG